MPFLFRKTSAFMQKINVCIICKTHWTSKSVLRFNGFANREEYLKFVAIYKP